MNRIIEMAKMAGVLAGSFILIATYDYFPHWLTVILAVVVIGGSILLFLFGIMSLFAGIDTSEGRRPEARFEP